MSHSRRSWEVFLIDLITNKLYVREVNTVATGIDEQLLSLQDRVGRFAVQTIAPRDDLHTMEGFPFDIWQKMGNEGLKQKPVRFNFFLKRGI